MVTTTTTTTTNTSSFTASSKSVIFPASQCVPWITVLVIECLAIVILNFITIVIFVTQRQRSRRGTSLLMRNLAVADLLVGAISAPLQIERVGENCDVWKYDTSTSWSYYLKFSFLHLFSMASLANLVAISLERMYLTFRPNTHRFRNVWIYKFIIGVIWSVAIIREIVQVVLREAHTHNNIKLLVDSTLYLPYYFVSLFIICLSYFTIFLKLRCTLRLDFECSAVVIRERRLTSMLFVVTLVSLLSLLPVVIYVSLRIMHSVSLNLSPSSGFHIRMAVIAFFLANSLVNPIIYSMRMRGFREALALLFNKAPNNAREARIQLRPHPGGRGNIHCDM